MAQVFFKWLSTISRKCWHPFSEVGNGPQTSIETRYKSSGLCSFSYLFLLFRILVKAQVSHGLSDFGVGIALDSVVTLCMCRRIPGPR